MLGQEKHRRSGGCEISVLARVLRLRLEVISQPSAGVACPFSGVAAGSILRDSSDDDWKGSAYRDAVDYHPLIERLVLARLVLPFFRSVLQQLSGSMCSS